MTSKISPFSIADPFGNSVWIDSLDDLERFVEAEIEYWNWLKDAGVADYPSRMDANFGTFRRLLDQFKSAEIGAAQLTSEIATYYARPNPPMYLSDFSPGNVVKMIFKAHGANDATLALNLLTGNVNLVVNDYWHMRVWGQLTTPTLIAADSWAADERKKLSEVRIALRRSVSDSRERLDAELTRIRNEESNARDEHWRLTGLALRAGVRRARRVRTLANESVSEINATNAAYTQHMALKAPVGYWRDKRTRHRTGAIAWGLVFAVYLWVSACVGVRLFNLAWEHAQGDGFSSRHFLVAAGLGTVLTMLIWLARILMRLFLGEMHLFTDAEERRVMTETYLALIKENGASVDERSLILAALFRSAQDGIVKEDVGGDVGILALAAKALEAKK